MKKIITTVALIVGLASTGAQAEEQKLNVYLTGYSWHDNTPAGSAEIARPVIHQKAGGKGTYKDPITLAVGHVRTKFSHRMDYPKGTRFYFPRIKKYAIVEDLCGDGLRPQDGPCHSGKNGKPWLDIYVDGSKAGKRLSDQCMRSITGFQVAIKNPRRNYPTVPGPLTESGCQTYK